MPTESQLQDYRATAARLPVDREWSAARNDVYTDQCRVRLGAHMRCVRSTDHHDSGGIRGRIPWRRSSAELSHGLPCGVADTVRSALPEATKGGNPI